MNLNFLIWLDWQTPGVLLSSPPHFWDSRHSAIHDFFQDHMGLGGGSGVLNSGPHACSTAGSIAPVLANLLEGLPCARHCSQFPAPHLTPHPRVGDRRQTRKCVKGSALSPHWKCLAISSTAAIIPSEHTVHDLSGEGTSSRNRTHPQDPIREERSNGQPWLLRSDAVPTALGYKQLETMECP